MAKVIKKQIQWNQANHFPWSQWADGRVWQIDQGIDFTTPTARMRQRLYAQAQLRGIRVRTKVEPDKPNSIIFQFFV